MRKGIAQLMIVLPLLFAVGGFVFATPIVDLRDALHSRYKANETQGDIVDFQKGTLEGNLYDRAYSLAQVQVAKPLLQALDLTYQNIANQCDSKGINSRDITNVFSRTDLGIEFNSLLESKDVINETQDRPFIKSCQAIYACYFHDQLVSKGVDVNPFTVFSDEVMQGCTAIVEQLTTMMYGRTSTLARMSSLNYGDDFLVNAKPDDGPYDLLLDVEAVGDVLFAHNDNPSEIHFYQVSGPENYVYNNPDDITPYVPKDPKTSPRTDRFPTTNGVSPSLPDVAKNSYPPAQAPAESSSSLPTPKTSAGKPPLSAEGFTPNFSTPGDSSQQFSSVAGESLGNQMCDPLTPLAPADTQDELTLAEEENQQTETYNDKLSLDDEVAILLAAKMSPQQEEEIGSSEDGSDSTDLGFSPEAQLQARGLIQEALDLAGDGLEEMKQKIQQCVEQFTEVNRSSRGKLLLKSVTQPAEFTKCVFGNLCKEIGDDSGRGMYSIKICKELRKANGIVNNQPVKSVEEVVDEMLNVCSNMRESGALLEHNKTKDHLEDKLMRIKLGNKFAFGISVIFKGSRDTKDPAVEKRLTVDRRKYLENYYLQFSDDLTFTEERNKYLLLQSADTARIGNEVNASITQSNQNILESLQKTQKDLEQLSQSSDGFNARAAKSQLDMYGKVDQAFAGFIEQNIQLRDVANQYTDSMNKRWKTTLNLFQSSKGN